jgi:peptide/nickel transport system substrate-binding protein
MKKYFLFALALLLAVSALPLFARGEVEDAGAGEEEAEALRGLVKIDHSAWEKGNPGGRFVRSTTSDPKSFNHYVAAETSTTDVTGMLYAGVIGRNQLTLEFEPKTAERWEVSDDQKTITFYLRKDLKWSDGTPLTAKDYVFGVNHVVLREDVQSNAKDGLYVNGVPSEWKLIDDYTFSVTIDTVYAGLFNLCGQAPAPIHIFGPLIGWDESMGYDYEWEWGKDEEGNDIVVESKPEGVDYSQINAYWGVDTDVTEIVGNGPFVLTEYVPNQRIAFKKNPYYYATDEWGQQLPYLDEMVYVVVEDQDTQLARFNAGETDFHGLRGEDFAVLINKTEEGDFSIYDVGPSASTNFLTFNMNPIEGEGDGGVPEPQHTWLSNKKFRQAMAHLIDRDTIITNMMDGFGFHQYSFIPRVSPYYWEGSDEAAFQYDPEAAKQLLDEINYIDRDGDGFREDPNGNKITMTVRTNAGVSVREGICEMVAQEAQAVGLDITAKPEDFNALVNRLMGTFDWELIVIGLTGSVDPISGANVYPSSGFLHMVEPNQVTPRRDWERRVDEAWKVANNTLDEDQRKRGYQTIQEIWIEEVPWAFTVNAAVMEAYRNKFGNVKPHPVSYYSWDGIIDRLYIK